MAHMLSSKERIGRAVHLACLLADTYYALKEMSKVISIEEERKLSELAADIQNEKIENVDRFCERWGKKDPEDRVLMEIIFNALIGYLGSKRVEH